MATRKFIIQRFDGSGNICGYLRQIGDYQPDHSAWKMHWTKNKDRALRIENEQPYISKEFGACLRLAPCEYNFRIIDIN